MHKFNKEYNMILEDIIQSVSPKELKERKEEYAKIRLKLMFENFFREEKMIKNPDGSYDVEGNIYIDDLNLRSLKQLPYVINKVNGFFSCSNNKLTSLEGCPKIVNGHFDCSDNMLISLEVCPNIINGYFDCSDNNLTSLVGSPKKIYNSFYCYNNPLISLEGCPKTVDGSFYCYSTLRKFTKEEIKKVCNVPYSNIYVN